MPTDACFRFSTYLTLALACVTMGYAEASMLPEVAVFALLSVLGLGVLYFLESRVALLSIPAANRLGGIIALGYALWAAYRIKREIDTGEMINMGWHLLIMAMCGPLVMVLLVAKGARRDKHAGDYFLLHGIALAGIGLAASFAEDLICFVLVALYLIAAVWSLALLHLGRARGAIPPIPGGKQPATKALAVSADPTGHRTDLRPAILWASVALALAVPLYLLTPRSTASKAVFGKPRVEIGYAADQMVDLNRTGPLQTNQEPAFEVTARNEDGGPRSELNPNQRWLGRTLRTYSNGEWKKPDGTELPQIIPSPSHPTTWSPPKLGEGQYKLIFEVPARLHATPQADPVLWAGDQPPPLAVLSDGTETSWLTVGDGTFFWDPPGRKTRRYVQIHRTGPDPDIGTPFRFADHLSERELEHQLAPLLQNPVARVKEYADALLRDLIDAGELPKECRDSVHLRPLPEYQDKIARRFAAHLAATPTLTYTTDLKRTNTQVDPIEDFLFYTKAGHCERFATALVLMLRSQGIPAMFVLGFKGHEADGEGHFIVRQEHAHAWVAALVAKPGEPVDKKKPLSTGVYQWRSLDPTPGAAQVADVDANRAWWEKANTWVETRFQEYVTNYTPEQRQKSLSGIGSRLMQVETLVGGALLIGLLVGARAVRRRIRARRQHAPPTVSEPGRWFGELVALLTAHGIVPGPGATPLEYATSATATLRARPGCAAVAEVPLAWAEAYYQDRYGGAPPSDARVAELEAGLGSLRLALQNRLT
jgi:transglutaminase-like putative cysteine protease